MQYERVAVSDTRRGDHPETVLQSSRRSPDSRAAHDAAERPQRLATSEALTPTAMFEEADEGLGDRERRGR
jgi:hypothetical protein